MPRRALRSSIRGLPFRVLNEAPLKPPPKNNPAASVPLLERIRRATLGRFDVMTALGEGGMATVFLARDLALDRQVAIKVMNPAQMSSPAALGRFRREARIAAALDHPHIISIFAVGEDAELAFYVMRYIEGRSLHDLIREEGAQTFRRVEGIVTDVGQALHYAHRRGVIHRDVKPANIMIDQDDWLIVTDFGIAKLDEGDRITLSGHVFGTPHYMSPEYFNGGLIGSASDQYALGVVTYELLTGSTPFPGETIGEVMRGHLFDPIPELCSVRPDLPQAVEECVHRMLAKEPHLRFPTVADAVASFRASGRSGESSVATELIVTSARSPIVVQPRRAPTARKPFSWPMRIALGIGGLAAASTAIILGYDILRAGTPEGDTRVPAALSTPDARQSDAGSGDTPVTLAGSSVNRRADGSSVDRRAPAPTSPVKPREVLSAPATEPPVVTGPPGTVHVGSRLELAWLVVGSEPPRLIGEQGMQAVSIKPGRVRVSIRKDGCKSWDSTFTVRSGVVDTIGWRNPRCP